MFSPFLQNSVTTQQCWLLLFAFSPPLFFRFSCPSFLYFAGPIFRVDDVFWPFFSGAFTHKTCIQRTIIIWILLNNLFSQRELNKQAYSWFSHYVTKTQTKKLSHLKTFIQTNFRFKRVLDAWISRLLCDSAFSQECSYVG